jgi:hypothetical protein
MLLDSGWAGDPGLRALAGGEALPRDLALRLLDRVGEVWNLYGPTETTIWSTVDRVERSGDVVPIGRPIDNTRVYVLDRRLVPQPVGLEGDLYIGGLGLARGYLGRPDLTASRFLPDPFRGDGARMYDTGDRARLGEDGRLVHRGRRDHQVKLRGFRVEPGEIEALLRAHPDVREAAVVVREKSPGDQRLVAYVVAGAGRPLPPAGELRRFLATRLPEYMVPTTIVTLPELPLTPNGKVDRARLPEPKGEREAVLPVERPRTDVERTIARVWMEVLDTGEVGLDDNFFDRGGHSLLLTRVQARLRETHAIDLRVTDLFRFPTVRTLALFVAEGSRASDADAGRERGDLRRSALGRKRRAP